MYLIYEENKESNSLFEVLTIFNLYILLGIYSEVWTSEMLQSKMQSMDVQQLLIQTESKTLEFKQDLSSMDGVLRSIVAFANTSGGTLVIGIKDKTRHVCGISDPLVLEERLANVINDKIHPRIIPEIEIVAWRNTYLLTIQIYPSANRPHYIKKLGLDKGTYIRIGSSNRLADKPLIEEIKRFVTLHSFDEQPVPELDSEALDFLAVSECFSEIRKLKPRDLSTLGLIVKHQKHNVPSVGGIILFGKKRKNLFPDAWVQAGRFAGKDKQNIIDNLAIYSYPVVAINEAISFVKKHLFHGVSIKGGAKHIEQWSVPIIAIRETIINAVVHADYSQQGAPIRISIFDDRIEIENPGILLFGLTIEDIHRGVSKLRNRVLGRIFYELRLIEQWGSGIQRILAVCKEAGFKEPTFEEIGLRFRVTIYTEKTDDFSQALDTVDQLIVTLLEDNKGYSTQEIAQHINYSPRATRTRLLRLVEKGLVAEVGSGPTDPQRRYYLVKR